MREKDRKKAEEKRKQELYDQKLEREMLNYDPFGKGSFQKDFYEGEIAWRLFHIDGLKGRLSHFCRSLSLVAQRKQPME